MNQNKLEYKICLSENLAVIDKDFLAYLTKSKTDFSIVLQVSPDKIIKSTGMIAVPSGIVTVEDIGRVLETALSLTGTDEVILQVRSTAQFLVGDSMLTDIFPIGIPSQKLEVTIELVRVNKQWLLRWVQWTESLGRRINGWHIKVVCD
mgnify:CR=1 FL=1